MTTHRAAGPGFPENAIYVSIVGNPVQAAAACAMKGFGFITHRFRPAFDSSDYDLTSGYISIQAAEYMKDVWYHEFETDPSWVIGEVFEYYTVHVVTDSDFDPDDLLVIGRK